MSWLLTMNENQLDMESNKRVSAQRPITGTSNLPNPYKSYRTMDREKEDRARRLRAAIDAKAAGRQKGSQPAPFRHAASYQRRSGAREGGGGPAPMSLKELEARFAAHSGDVDSMLAAMNLPPDIGAIAKDHASTLPEHRNLEASLAKAEQAMLGQRHPK